MDLQFIFPRVVESNKRVSHCAGRLREHACETVFLRFTAFAELNQSAQLLSLFYATVNAECEKSKILSTFYVDKYF